MAFNQQQADKVYADIMAYVKTHQNPQTKWKVSVKMMIQRCVDLDIVSDQRATQLHISYSRRGWGQFEPLDDMPVEQPGLLAKGFDLIKQSGYQSGPDVLFGIGLYGNDIMGKIPLSKEFFEEVPVVTNPSIRLISSNTIPSNSPVVRERHFQKTA